MILIHIPLPFHSCCALCFSNCYFLYPASSLLRLGTQCVSLQGGGFHCPANLSQAGGLTLSLFPFNSPVWAQTHAAADGEGGDGRGARGEDRCLAKGIRAGPSWCWRFSPGGGAQEGIWALGAEGRVGVLGACLTYPQGSPHECGYLPRAWFAGPTLPAPPYFVPAQSLTQQGWLVSLRLEVSSGKGSQWPG